MKADKTKLQVRSGSVFLEFSTSVFGEIGCRGALQALVAVDGAVDLVIRKFKPILGRVVLQTLVHHSLRADLEGSGRRYRPLIRRCSPLIHSSRGTITARRCCRFTS